MAPTGSDAAPWGLCLQPPCCYMSLHLVVQIWSLFITYDVPMNQTVPTPTHAGRLKAFLSAIVPTDVQCQEKWKVRLKVRLKMR